MFMRHILFITLLISLINNFWPIPNIDDLQDVTYQEGDEISISELKDAVRSMQKKADINSYFKMKHAVVSGELYNNEVWRFDLGLNTPYQFTAENDSIDIAGLQKGLVKFIVFFSFGENENSIISKSIYYCDENDSIHEVKFIENTERESIIFS
ncbi:hypothetical protein SAFG77S_08933 [Streptomyces afghaniensis]